MAMYPCLSLPSLSFPTLTGSIVTFNSQYALPLKSHKIALTATQSGSGTPSPSNPRPITGYSAINISHSDADTSNPTVYTIQIGSTVYGGEYDARTGVLTVTHKGVDLGTLDWIVVTNQGIARTGGQNQMKYLGNNLCTQYKSVSSNDLNDLEIAVTNSQSLPLLRVRNVADFTDKTPAQVKTLLLGVMLVYELATPTTIQLPPCPIDTLIGVNNIWADTGDTTLQYPKFG